MPLIDRLIDKVDCFELVRDQIAAILLAETANQQALAVAALPPRDLLDFAFRVYLERSNAIGEFLDLPRDDQTFVAPRPIVNVWYHKTTFDMGASNVVERQKGTSTYFVDCYAYAASENAVTGHRPGDLLASLGVHQLVRLVRNVLMSATNTYLGMRGTVWRRWVASIDIMEPAQDSHAAQNIAAARITLQVDHSEFSPQVTGEPFEALSVHVKRADTGELYFTATFPDGDEEP